MTAEAIGRRLDRFPFPAEEPRPSADRYATWPGQAALLCAGKLDELEALQETLVDKWGAPSALLPSAPNKDEDGAAAPGLGRLFWQLLALGALLLLAALLAGWIASRSAACDCDVPPVPGDGPTVETANLSADLLFDYKMSQPRSDAHRAKIVADLRGLFHEFDGIRIVGVAAHTDPIGSTKDNRTLGQARASTIRGLIAGIIAQPEREGQFAPDPMPPDQAPDGPGREDAPYWKTCFTQYQLNIPKLERPLINLNPLKNTDNRVSCSNASADVVYPACARPDVPKFGQRLGRGYAQRAENLRELTGCLAPMRHVLIRFSYVRLALVPDEKKPTSITGAP